MIEKVIKIKVADASRPMFFSATEEDFEQAAKNAGYEIVKKPTKYERPKIGKVLLADGSVTVHAVDVLAEDYYSMFNVFPYDTDMERIKGYIQRTFAVCLACELVNRKSGFVPDWDDSTQLKYFPIKDNGGWSHACVWGTTENCGAAVGSKEDSEQVSELLTEWGV